ncbi:cell wall-binding repeat-containing protein [Ornithinimicrobium murale]|uniref:cell wall-binding repeat-containing protein n=1 Tax=Ornithinimicrobium murale TaxID=1050153 RepID=UPI0013B3D6E0|nr:cell wall-binding repeat-containing protein [Ornithinimicrobium murale]
MLLAAVLALGLAAPASADAPVPDDRQQESSDPVRPAADPVFTVPLDRLGGKNRYETSVAVSSAQFASADTVYLARSDVFADAIAAGSLRDGPVLLVPRCDGLPHVIADEIDRLDPAEVVALGGEKSICGATLQTAAKGREAVRLGGADRFETATLIAQRSFPDGSDTVYLAEQQESIDAVAGGTLTDGPILLVRNGEDSAPAVTVEAVQALDPDKVIALGGKLVVTTPALAHAAGEGRTTQRISGEDRYATSAAIAHWAFPEGSSRTYLANGRSVADSIVGGVLTRGPILLVPDNCRVLSEPVWRRLGEHPPEKVVALGGQQAVCTEQLRTGGRLSVFSGMETEDTGRLYDLVTKQRPVDPERYVPGDLVSWRGTSHQFRPETATMLQELFDDAAAAGHPGLWVNSAYRSYDEQQRTYDYWVRTVGKKRADLISAQPGHSEHQLGLAADVAGRSCSGYACFGDTPEGKWVAANAHRYGFIIRYPEGGTGVTGYDYEPWHLRYVGPRAAWMMHVRDEIYWDTYQRRAVAEAMH